MEKAYLVFTEDNEFIGITADLQTAKRLARKEFSCKFDHADLKFKKDWDEWDSQHYWIGECFANPTLPILLIAEIPFFDNGTKFPADVAEDLPNWLRRQAE